MTYRYDPELTDAAAAAPLLDAGDPAGVRRLLAALNASVPPFRFPETVAHRSELVPAPDGSVVEVHITAPRSAGSAAPALLWFHGGGFVFGSSSMDFPLHAHLAEHLGVVVISVEYSLSPEAPYPAAVEEGYAVAQWAHSRAAELGIDATRIAVGGHSAGGCLATTVALMARDRMGPPLCFQMLDLPVTDDRLATPSMRAFDDTPIWDRSNAAAGWRAYIGGADAATPVGGADAATPVGAAPARATDLGGLPPSYVSVAEFDPLRDEGIDYAQRLVQAGVSTELHLFPGTFHGSVAAVPDAAVSVSMVDHLTRALGRAFAGQPAGASTGATH